MKFWPFKKKKVMTKHTLRTIKELVEEQKHSCPEHHVKANHCICLNCPLGPRRTRNCSYEKNIRQSKHCSTPIPITDDLQAFPYISSCSYQKYLRGDFDAKKEDEEGQPRITDTRGIFNDGDFFGFGEIFENGGRDE